MAFWKENIRVIIILCLLLVLFFPDVVFLGKTFKITSANPQAMIYGPYGQEDNHPEFFPIYTSDVSLNEEPILEFIKRSLRDGILPLWNPHLGCGYPIIGHLHVGMFYPLNLIYYLLPDRYAWDFLIFARMLLGGLFTYWFMRTLKFSFSPSLISAVMFMLSRPMVVLHAWMVNVDILIPLFLLTIENLIQRPNTRNMCFTALVIGLSCFAGHPEHLVLMHTLGVLFFIFRLANIRPRPAWVRTSFLLTLSYIFGLGSAAIVLFPFLYNWFTEFWHAHPSDMGSLAELSGMPKFILTVLFPSYLQKYPLNYRFDSAGWWGAVGILPIGLSLMALWRRDQRKLHWLFLCVAMFIFLKVLVNPPIVKWIGHIPPLSFIRFSNHSGHMFAFLLAVLSGMGVDYILRSSRTFGKFLIFAIFCWIVMGIALFVDRHAPYFQNALTTSLVSSVIIMLFLLGLFLKDKGWLKNQRLALWLLLVICAELFYYVPRGRVRKFDSFPPVPYIDFIKDTTPQVRSYGVLWTLYPNTAAGYRIDDLGIYEGLHLKRFVDFINTFIEPDYFQKDYTRTAFWVFPYPLLPEIRPYTNLLNLKYLVVSNPLAEPSKKNSFLTTLKALDPIYSREVNIYEITSALPRAFIVHKAIFEPDEEILIEKMRSSKDKFSILAFIHNPPREDIMEQLRPAPLKDESSVTIEKYTPNEVLLKADMAHHGLVVLSDSYHPDWQAFIDGQPSQIFITDYLIRSVFVPQGPHFIRFVFRPASFYIGRTVSLISFLTLIILLMISIQRKDPSQSKNSISNNRSPGP